MAGKRNSIKSDLKRLDTMKEEDEDIDYSDMPKLGKEFWHKTPVTWPPKKNPVTLRIDEDVLGWFKAQGARYQTKMNAVLRAYVKAHQGKHAN
jgi:uncharacterized protein (DUF4415 family)